MNEKYKVVYSPVSVKDLRDIYSYIAFTIKAESTAKKQTGRIRKEVHSLDFMPNRYAIVDCKPWQSMQMHKLSVDNYVVYYMVDAEEHTVTFVRIFYGGRDVEGIVQGDTA